MKKRKRPTTTTTTIRIHMNTKQAMMKETNQNTCGLYGTEQERHKRDTRAIYTLIQLFLCWSFRDKRE